MSGPLLDVKDLTVRHGSLHYLEGISFGLAPRERLAVVGASGAGKTLLARALLGLLPPGMTLGGTMAFDGHPITPTAIASLRGRGMAFVGQQARLGLNPLRTIGQHMADVWRSHSLSPSPILADVGLTGWEKAFPHELSGGMAQRAALARALAAAPRLLIADEPTSHLDPATAADILALLARLAEQRGMAMMLITHDMAVAEGFCPRRLTLREGRVIMPERSVFSPLSPASAVNRPALLRVKGITKRFAGATIGPLSFTLHQGEALGLLGPSGCGKSTLAHILARLTTPDAGSVAFNGHDLTAVPLSKAARAPWRRDVQLVMQEAVASLNPRQTALAAVMTPLTQLCGLHGAECQRAAREALQQVGLLDELHHRLPHHLSGGQAARVALARAIAVNPALLIVDEVTASLDRDSSDHILRVLAHRQRDRGMTLLVISHDSAVLSALCTRRLDMTRQDGVEWGNQGSYHE